MDAFYSFLSAILSQVSAAIITRYIIDRLGKKKELPPTKDKSS